MRKILILITFISSLIGSSVAYAKWTKVAEDAVEDGSYYVDLERIKRHEGKVYYWQLSDFSKPTKTGMISYKVYTEAECGLLRRRWLNFTTYKGRMGSGKVSSRSTTPQKDWTYPAPDTNDEAILKAVCNHKP